MWFSGCFFFLFFFKILILTAEVYLQCKLQTSPSCPGRWTWQCQILIFPPEFINKGGDCGSIWQNQLCLPWSCSGCHIQTLEVASFFRSNVSKSVVSKRSFSESGCGWSTTRRTRLVCLLLYQLCWLILPLVHVLVQVGRQAGSCYQKARVVQPTAD